MIIKFDYNTKIYFFLIFTKIIHHIIYIFRSYDLYSNFFIYNFIYSF